MKSSPVRQHTEHIMKSDILTIVHFFHFIAHVLEEQSVLLGEDCETTLLLVFVLYAGVENSTFVKWADGGKGKGGKERELSS